jgi:hypothetical protein
MISANTLPSGRRLVALIVPGGGPHLVAPSGGQLVGD